MRKGDWMQTYMGIQYWPADPRSSEVNIIDIAHHLSNICRFTGAVRQFYSVAEHSVHVSYLVPEEFAFEGLMHDAHEAYINDVARPVKSSLPDYKTLEQRNWEAVAHAFGLPFRLPPVVKGADNAILFAEQRELMPVPSAEWLVDGRTFPIIDVSNVRIQCWSPPVAKAAFLQRFNQLSSEGT